MPIIKGHDNFLGKLSDCERYKYIFWFRKLRNTEKTLESGKVQHNGRRSVENLQQRLYV